MLTSQDVGCRVVVRQRVGVGTHGRPLFADLLGELVLIDEDQLIVRTRDGVTRAVPRALIAAAKRVPPRPTGYREIIELEWAGAEVWPAPVRERLGDWLLRSAGGWTNRANSALPLGDPGRPLEAAIDAVVDWYARRGQPARFGVPLPLCRRLDEALTARGWTNLAPVLVQVADLSTLTDVPGPDDPRSARVRLHETPTPAWLAAVAGRKGELPPVAGQVLTGVDQVRFAHVYAADGTLAASARGALSPDRRWLGLALMGVEPAHRRRGLAARMVRELAHWAATLGATRAFLQVEETNEPAVALYSRLGFTTHHRYHNRHEPDPAAPRRR